MAQLCLPRRCGCALHSTTLTVAGTGSVESPYHLDLAPTQLGERLRIVADAAARDALLPAPTDGTEAYLTTPNQLTRYVDGAWRIVGQPTTAFTPTITGITVGNGTLAAWYGRNEDVVSYQGRFIFGTTSVATGTLGPISLPVPSPPSTRQTGEAGLFDNSTAVIHPVTVDVLTATPGLYLERQTGTTTFFVTSTAPFTWAVGDELYWNVDYWAL
jgi:hypothetical protein